MAKAQEFRDLADNELEARYLDERKKLFNMINEREAGGGKQFDKPHRIKEAKRDIARLLTIQRERQLAQRKEA